MTARTPGPFTVAAGNVELILSGIARFSLNTDCATLQQFHEQIGLKFAAYSEDDSDSTSDGGRKMIATYVQAPLQRAMNDATQGSDWVALYNDPQAKADWEKRVGNSSPPTSNRRPEAFNVYQALKDGKLTFMAIPQGGNVIAPAPSPAAS
ncbi:MAG: hypothetical protein ACRYF3_01325 [Janthinobacterium lividum]